MDNQEKEIERIKKQWGGEAEPEEEFDAIEFFGDAGDAAEEDIKDEYGEEEFASFGSMEDPRMLATLNEEEKLRQKIREVLSEIELSDDDEDPYNEYEEEKNPENFHFDLKSLYHYLKDAMHQLNVYSEEEIAEILSKTLERDYNITEKPLNEEEELDEERIVNSKAKEHVNNKENFIGSHIFGEDLGGLGKMYVAYSYGEQFPAYVWHNDKWYHNTDTYKHGGEVVNATEKHKEDMRPSAQTSGMSLKGLQSMIKKFMKKNGISDVNHKEVEPGEKN